MENFENPEEGIKADVCVEQLDEEIIPIISPNHNTDSTNSTNGVTSEENNNRKLFIGGLSKQTTESEIRNYFCVYGNIESIKIMPCSGAGKSKGFAFIVFETAETVNLIKAVGNHIINEVPVKVQIAKSRQSKIFINLPNELEEEDVNTYFSQFGNIVKMEMPRDKVTNERKGFCVITYDSSEKAINDLVQTPIHTIKDTEVSIQKSPFMGLEEQINSNRRKNASKKQNAGSSKSVRGVRSAGKIKAKQGKKFGNRKNLIRNDFNGRNLSNLNNQGNNFVGQNFSGRQNFHVGQSFDGGLNFVGRQNFDGGYYLNGGPNFGSQQNFNRKPNNRSRQNFGTENTYGNGQHSMVGPALIAGRNPFERQNPNVNRNDVGVQNQMSRQNHPTSVGRQNLGSELNFGNEQTNAQFLHTQNNSSFNNFDVRSLNSQNLGLQNTIKQVYGGNDEYQQGYWSTYAGLGEGNAGSAYSGTNNNFRHKNKKNANKRGPGNIGKTMNIVGNQGYNDYSGNEFFHNSAYVNYNNNNGGENMNEGFGFVNSRPSGIEGVQGNMRSMNGRKRGGRKGVWTGPNTINPNQNRQY